MYASVSKIVSERLIIVRTSSGIELNTFLQNEVEIGPKVYMEDSTRLKLSSRASHCMLSVTPAVTTDTRHYVALCLLFEVVCKFVTFRSNTLVAMSYEVIDGVASASS